MLAFSRTGEDSEDSRTGEDGRTSVDGGPGVVVAVNLSDRAVPAPPGRPLLASDPAAPAGTLPPDGAVWVRPRALSARFGRGARPGTTVDDNRTTGARASGGAFTVVTRTRYRSPGSIITAIFGLIAGIIVLGIFLVLVDANHDNTIVDFILDIGRFFAQAVREPLPAGRPEGEHRGQLGHRGARYLLVGAIIARHRPPGLTPTPDRRGRARLPQRPPGKDRSRWALPRRVDEADERPLAAPVADAGALQRAGRALGPAGHGARLGLAMLDATVVNVALPRIGDGPGRRPRPACSGRSTATR